MQNKTTTEACNFSELFFPTFLLMLGTTQLSLYHQCLCLHKLHLLILLLIENLVCLGHLDNKIVNRRSRKVRRKSWYQGSFDKILIKII